MPLRSTTIFTLAYLLPLSLAHLPQQKTPFKRAILYNKSIADAHPSFLFEEAILLFLYVTGIRCICLMRRYILFFHRSVLHVSNHENLMTGKLLLNSLSIVMCKTVKGGFQHTMCHYGVSFMFLLESWRAAEYTIVLAASCRHCNCNY